MRDIYTIKTPSWLAASLLIHEMNVYDTIDTLASPVRLTDLEMK